MSVHAGKKKIEKCITHYGFLKYQPRFDGSCHFVLVAGDFIDAEQLAFLKEQQK